MRISDWSSDVCSSDLRLILANNARVRRGKTATDGSINCDSAPFALTRAHDRTYSHRRAWPFGLYRGRSRSPGAYQSPSRDTSACREREGGPGHAGELAAFRALSSPNRKNVGEGKVVAVR